MQRENPSAPLRPRLVTTKSETRRLKACTFQIAYHTEDKSARSTGSADFVVASLLPSPSCTRLERMHQMLTMPPSDSSSG